MNNSFYSPPRIADRLLRKFIRPEIMPGAAEDFSEQFDWICRHRGRRLAVFWYWVQILHLLPGFIGDFFYWRAMMFMHNLKLYLRNIRRNKTFSLINVSGLVVGLTSCMLLLLWVQDEISYDRFHEHGRHIYRVIAKDRYKSGISYSAVTSAPIAPLIKSLTPEVVDFARYWPETVTFKLGEKGFPLASGIIDPSFLDMFSFPILKGDRESALSNPASILLTEETAEKIFGKEDPLGKILLFEGRDITVTGVIADVPRNSHLQFACLLPLSLVRELGVDLENWAHSRYFSYVRLHPEARFSAVNDKIRELEQTHAPGGSNSELQLQPFTKIYLYGLNSRGPIAYVYLFSFVAFLSLILAAVNFTNLTTARSSQRAKEIGLRKVVGAGRRQIILQLIGETLFLTLTSLVLAASTVVLVLPAFNSLSGKQISLNIQGYSTLGLGLFLIVVVTGLLAGGYPALFLSSFMPVKTLKGISSMEAHGGAPRLRKILVVFQFALSIALIICTIVIHSQLHFMRHRDLGIDISNVVCIPVDNLGEDYETLKAELSRDPRILQVSASSFPLASYAFGTSAAEWEGKEKEERVSMGLAMVDFDTFENYRLEIAAGRPFSQEFATDAAEAYIVNETAVSAMGLQDPIGKKFSWNQRDGRIIGVVRDYHNRSLHQEIQPLVFLISPSWFRYLSIRISPEAGAESLGFIKERWEKLRPGQELSHFFLDSYVDGFYRSELRMGKVIRAFTLIAIFISCLGLFGLTVFSAEQRTKEIGVRKVLGASVSRIVVMLSRDFTRRVLLANLIAWPAAYYFMHKWLRNFAYRTRMEFWMFLTAAALAMLIALLTVGYQAVKAALADPMDSMRYE